MCTSESCLQGKHHDGFKFAILAHTADQFSTDHQEAIGMMTHPGSYGNITTGTIQAEAMYDVLTIVNLRQGTATKHRQIPVCLWKLLN